jgi:hypothetical protein
MRLFISGGAPLPKYAGDFMATAMNVPVLQVRAVSRGRWQRHACMRAANGQAVAVFDTECGGYLSVRRCVRGGCTCTM